MAWVVSIFPLILCFPSVSFQCFPSINSNINSSVSYIYIFQYIPSVVAMLFPHRAILISSHCFPACIPVYSSLYSSVFCSGSFHMMCFLFSLFHYSVIRMFSQYKSQCQCCCLIVLHWFSQVIFQSFPSSLSAAQIFSKSFNRIFCFYSFLGFFFSLFLHYIIVFQCFFWGVFPLSFLVRLSVC